MKEKLYLVDTTLRDGEQSPGYAFTKEQKVKVASLLDEIGIYQIEAGIPAMGAYEKDTLCEIMAGRKNAVVSTWNRMKLPDIQHSLDCRPDIIHISAPVSYVQIYSKLKKNKIWLQRELKKCVSFAKDKGFEVTVGFEDASRADTTFMIGLAAALRDIGVRRIRLADTVGVMTPSRTYETVSEIIKYTGIDVEIHTHNDLGMAAANALEAAKAGAKYIDTTFHGIGERAGNCDLGNFILLAERLFTVSPSRFTALMAGEKFLDIIGRNDDAD